MSASQLAAAVAAAEPPFVLGLTGSIGMGKSTVGQMFEDAGIPVLDSDQVVHHLYRPGGRAVAAVLAAFPGAGSPEEGIDRAALSRLALASPDGLLRLEAIVHPAVREAQREWIEEYRAQARDRLADEAARGSRKGEEGGEEGAKAPEPEPGPPSASPAPPAPPSSASASAPSVSVSSASAASASPAAPPSAASASSSPPALIMDVPLLFETGGESRCDATVVVSAPEALQRERVLARPGMTPQKLDAILKRQLPDAEKRAKADYVIDTSVTREETRAQVEQVVVLLQRLARGKEEAALRAAAAAAAAADDGDAIRAARCGGDDAIRAAIAEGLRGSAEAAAGGAAGARPPPRLAPATAAALAPPSPPPSPASPGEPTFPRLSLPRRSPSLGPLGAPAREGKEAAAAVPGASASSPAQTEAVRAAEARLQAAETAAVEAEARLQTA